ncbi:MAG TPA: NAD(P)H-hydrate dehydratase [Feifaniaceae bacterium]|nr:NAD(P)H-hydrate dehydratase [Feifaniaceae bacterium]
MRQVLTPAQMRGMEAELIGGRHIPGLVLMEHAAAGVKDAVLRLLPEHGRVLAVCGGGNNGGDGLSALRQLHALGVSVEGVLLAPPQRLKGDALLQYEMAAACKIPISDASGGAEFPVSADVLIDAVFGTGLSRNVEGIFLKAIARMNASGVPVVSVDIPSGIDGGTGRVLGDAVRASVTVTFQHKKLGHLLFPGRAYAGEAAEVPIGPAIDVPEAAFMLEEADVRRLLPPRPQDSHKGQNGRALLAAGSKHYAGAALLAANAALRGGCGLLHAAVPRGIHFMFARCPGAICHPVGDGDEWTSDAAAEAAALITKADALAIGPGLGGGEGVAPLLKELLFSQKPLVIDADGLNAVSKNRELFSLLHPNVILTPHPAEMARLIQGSVEDVLHAPLDTAKRAAISWGCTVLLKGATTVITDGARVCLNTTGNSGLAKGGSGDVLTGVTLSLLSQGLTVFDAACAGAYLLGSAAEKAYALLGTRMLLAADVIDALGAE